MPSMVKFYRNRVELEPAVLLEELRASCAQAGAPAHLADTVYASAFGGHRGDVLFITMTLRGVAAIVANDERAEWIEEWN